MALPKLATATYELQLPSTAETVKYRPFLVKEQKVLMMASESKDNKQINVEISKIKNNKIKLTVIDEGEGFKEKDTSKIFKRFYSNRPGKFGEHSGLGLNIVKNLVDLHNGEIFASNNKNQGAKMEIIFPEA